MSILAISFHPNDIELGCSIDLEKQAGGIYGLEY
jgi:hypothetical protein